MESFNEEKQKIQQSIYLGFFSLPWIVRLRFPKSNFEADHQHLLDRKVFYVDMLDILHRVPSATCSPRFCFPSPILPMPSVYHSVPRFSARMVYRDYESMEEQSVFEKDPSKRDTSTQSPLSLEKKCRVHRDAVDIVLYLLVTLVAGGYKFGQKRGIRARTTAFVPTHAQATIPNFLLFSSVFDFVLVCEVFGVLPFLSWCISGVSKEKFAMQGFYLPEVFTYI